MPLADLAAVAKKQGVVAALALGLLGVLGYMVKTQLDQAQMNGRRIARLAQAVDALGDLVISACDPSAEQVQKFHEAKRQRDYGGRDREEK